MSVLLHLAHVFRFWLFAYTALAVIYTSVYLVLCPFVNNCSASFAPRIPKWAPDRLSSTWSALVHGSTASPTPTVDAHVKQPSISGRSSLLANQNGRLSSLDSISSNSMISWSSSGSIVSNASTSLASPFMMPESLFLSKAFANSMQPMNIIPFFYRASESFPADDITITTLVTPNRLPILRKLAERYPGPLSVTLHLPLSASITPTADLEALHALLRSTPALAARADIHVVLSPFPRAFNAWRNIARLFARTDFVLLLDVDFAVCTAWRAPVRALLRAGGEMAQRLREGRAALVLPAFEYVRAEDGTEQARFPRDKAALLALVQAKQIAPFHAAWAQGHNSTDYPRFYAARPGEIYRVAHYQSAYEPYVIVRRDADGWCDERFTGYGGNKAACLFEMYLAGVSFYVLGDHFLIHQSHAYEEEARRNERRHNRKIYADFKEEACLRYLKRLYDQGALNTTRGHNAQEECRKLKGIRRVVTQLLDGQ